MAAKEDIITLPNKHLREKSRRVGIIDEKIVETIHNMEAATLDWEASRQHEVGVALAAIQIDQKLRIVIIREDIEDKKNHNFLVFINPEITKQEGEIIEDFEGCLSIKDIYGKVPRYNKVRVKALDIHGNVFRVSAEGFIARVLQHEIDHTKGVLFIDHIHNSPQAFFRLETSGKLTKLDYAKDIKGNLALWVGNE